MGELGSEVEINAVSKAIVVVRDDRQTLGRVQQEKHITTELNSTPDAEVEIGLCLAGQSTFTPKARGRLMPNCP